MSKHTRGEWVAVGSRVNSRFRNSNDICIFDPYNRNKSMGSISYAEWCANARLIAAAPELLEALIRLELHDRAANLRDGSDDCLELKRAREAISKARGEA